MRNGGPPGHRAVDADLDEHCVAAKAIVACSAGAGATNTLGGCSVDATLGSWVRQRTRHAAASIGMLSQSSCMTWTGDAGTPPATLSVQAWAAVAICETNSNPATSPESHFLAALQKRVFMP